MSRQGKVYFFRSGAFVKIGFSTNHIERLAAISAATPENLSVVALHDGTQATEVAFHKLLAAHHHRNEWFNWCDEVEHAAKHGLPELTVAAVNDDALEEARRIAGGDTGLARLLGGGLTSQACQQWKKVPALRVIAVERATGVPRERLRPDLYPSIQSSVA